MKKKADLFWSLISTVFALAFVIGKIVVVFALFKQALNENEPYAKWACFGIAYILTSQMLVAARLNSLERKNGCSQCNVYKN